MTLLYTLLEQHVCGLHGQDKVKSINYARYTMFKLGKCTADSLAPNFDSLHQNILQASPSPVGYGWKLEDNQLQIVWGTQEPAAKSILECVHCKCQKGCKTRRCSCYKSDPSCENSDILAVELSEIKAQLLENEFEEGDVDDDDDDY